MTVGDIQKAIEEWAPKEVAWERDNVGLQVGSSNATVKRVLVCLDVTEEAVREAIRRRAELIVSHHPLLFRPLRSMVMNTPAAKCVGLLLKSNVSLYAVHTNLDFAHNGTSFALARKLGLNDLDFLVKSYRLSKKIVTYVPAQDADRVADAMAGAGAGRIGNYEMCSFRTRGTGTFRGNEDSRPTIGARGKLEHTDEIRLEMIVDQPRLPAVLQSMLRAHPYEEAAYDIYPLENVSSGYGMGVMGQMARSMPVGRFTKHVMKSLNVKSVRSTRKSQAQIRTVAVCGGGGSDLVDEAIRAGADAFVTADVKYHTFQDANGRILLVDAGHYETERPVVDVLVQRLRKEFGRNGSGLAVYAARTSTNPIVYN